MPGASNNTMTQGMVFKGFLFSAMITRTNPSMVMEYNMMNITPATHCICMAASMLFILCYKLIKVVR